MKCERAVRSRVLKRTAVIVCNECDFRREVQDHRRADKSRDAAEYARAGDMAARHTEETGHSVVVSRNKETMIYPFAAGVWSDA